jgi:protein ImuA
LAALEAALGSAGVACAIGETADVDLTAGRRLQLACEKRGATGFVIRRRPFGAQAGKAAGRSDAGSAAATRWTVASVPSEPLSGFPGLGPPRWRVDLERCRGGRPGSWILEMSDGAYPLRVVAPLADGQLEAPPSRRVAG